MELLPHYADRYRHRNDDNHEPVRELPYLKYLHCVRPACYTLGIPGRRHQYERCYDDEMRLLAMPTPQRKPAPRGSPLPLGPCARITCMDSMIGILLPQASSGGREPAITVRMRSSGTRCPSGRRLRFPPAKRSGRRAVAPEPPAPAITIWVPPPRIQPAVLTKKPPKARMSRNPPARAGFFLDVRRRCY